MAKSLAKSVFCLNFGQFSTFLLNLDSLQRHDDSAEAVIEMTFTSLCFWTID